MNQVDFHLVISGMKFLIAGGMIIGHRDRLLLGLFDREMDTDHGIELPSVSIVVNVGVLGHLDPLDRHIREIADIAARVLDLEASMRGKPIYRCPEGRPVMSLRSKC